MLYINFIIQYTIIQNSLNDIKTNTLSIMFYMNKLFSLAEQEEKKIQIKREEYIKKKKTFNIPSHRANSEYKS